MFQDLGIFQGAWQLKTSKNHPTQVVANAMNPQNTHFFGCPHRRCPWRFTGEAHGCHKWPLRRDGIFLVDYFEAGLEWWWGRAGFQVETNIIFHPIPGDGSWWFRHGRISNKNHNKSKVNVWWHINWYSIDSWWRIRWPETLKLLSERDLKNTKRPLHRVTFNLPGFLNHSEETTPPV